MTRTKAITETVTIHVPFRIVKRGGRKEIQLPPITSAQRKTDGTLGKALARAFRWTRMLETGEYTTIADLAKGEAIAPSYLTRVMRLTLLAPELDETILDGHQEPEMTLARLMEPFPLEWEGQRATFI